MGTLKLSTVLLASAVMLVIASSAITTKTAADPNSAELTRVLISELPDKESTIYKKLYEIAGRPIGEVLEMTKAEVWSVPVQNWPRFASEAQSIGVKIEKLASTWNHALSPVPASTPMTLAQENMMHDAMGSKASVGMITMTLPAAGAVEYALTNGMHDPSGANPPPTLVIPISNSTHISARRIYVTKAAGGWAWHGVTEETGETVTLLWWPSGKMTGSATYKGHVYAIHDMGGGMHGIVQMNPAGLPEDHAPMSAEMRDKMKMTVDPLVSKGDASELMSEKTAQPGASTQPSSISTEDNSDRLEVLRNLEDAKSTLDAAAVPSATAITLSPTSMMPRGKTVTIRVMVAYTAAAARRYSDIETDLIALAIEQANQSFRVSGIGNVQLEVAFAYQTTYVEMGSHFDHVFRFANRNDGYMDEVHALRGRHQADIALLIVHDPNGCGLAAEVFARPEKAFAVVHHECASNSHSLAHEIGHLIGARHDEMLDRSMTPFSFGHGFVHGTEWRTMMSYKESCGGCMRIPIWSNPDVLVNGVPAGGPTANNARVIAENAARVAGFRAQLRDARPQSDSRDDSSSMNLNSDR